MTNRRRVRAFFVAGMVAVVTTVGLGCVARALPNTSQPQLSLNRLIRTSPFVGSTVSVRDNEGTAYVASDDALWMADDNSNSIYEIDRTTGALRRQISVTAFVNAPRLGVGTPAGTTRNQDLEAIAYDANADVLFAFSGSTSSVPTAYRLARDASHRFQVESWQPLSSEHTGAGWRLADGRLYLANGSSLTTYDYATNTLGATFSISGLTKIFGIDFDDASGDLVAVNSSEQLIRASMSTRNILPGWTIGLTGFGIADSRAVEVIGNQLFVSDGLDTRAATDPMNHAIFVFDVAGPGPTRPTASFLASATSGLRPLPVTFTDTSTGNPTAWSWTFGDGTTSTAQSPTHTYTATGTFTATLTAANSGGSSSASRTITVSEPASGTTVSLDADTYVNTDSPTKNYATYPVLKLHSPTAEYRPLIKFTLAGFTRAPTSVRLRLYVTDASDRGGDWFAMSNAWTESGVVWNNAPAPTGPAVASVGPVAINTWIDVDLTAAVTGNGTYSFAATSVSTNTLIFSSREGSFAPQVIVTP